MKISVNEDYVKIDLGIKEKIGAARGSLKIPFKNIVSAFSEPPSHPSGIKIVGTNIPGMIELGTYLAGTQKEFWYTKKGKVNYLVLVLKSDFYSRVIVETENSIELAQKIMDNA